MDNKRKQYLTYGGLALAGVVVVAVLLKRGQTSTAGQPDSATLGQYAAVFRGNGAGSGNTAFLTPQPAPATPPTPAVDPGATAIRGIPHGGGEAPGGHIGPTVTTLFTDPARSFVFGNQSGVPTRPAAFGTGGPIGTQPVLASIAGSAGPLARVGHSNG